MLWLWVLEPMTSLVQPLDFVVFVEETLEGTLKYIGRGFDSLW